MFASSGQRISKVVLAAFCGSLLPSVALAQQPPPQDDPSFNLQRETGKPGVYAYRYPGPYYGVSAFTSKTRKLGDADLVQLGQQVMLRSALLALDNGRAYFTIIGRIDTATTGAKDEYVAGTRGYKEADQMGRDGAGRTFYIPGKQVAGSPGRTIRNPGYFGRRAMVQIWTATEAKLMEEGRLKRPSAKLISAEEYYRRYREQTAGRWPTIEQINAFRNRRR